MSVGDLRGEMAPYLGTESTPGRAGHFSAPLGFNFGTSQPSLGTQDRGIFEPRLDTQATTEYLLPCYVVDPAWGASNAGYEASVAWRSQLVSRAVAERHLWRSQGTGQAIRQLAQQLEQASAGRSALRRVARLPAYRRLIDIAPLSVAVALERLAGDQRPLWLFFLQNAVLDRPAAGAANIDEAASAWRRWGRAHGYFP